FFATELRGRVRLRRLTVDGDERHDADVRELTAAWRSSDTTFTLGAQQLNWGRMDILRVTDVINPVDQHDLFHEELPEAKLAIWMANLEWQNGSRTLQIIATPQVPMDRLARRWGGLPVDVAEPRSSLRNSTLAVRYGFEALGWNADVMASRGWQSTPTLRLVMDARGPHLQGVVSRQNNIGFSADKPLGGTVLRLEGLVAWLKPNDAPAALAVGDHRQVSLGAGIDVRVDDWFFAGQVIAQNECDSLEGSSRNIYASVIVQRKWMQDRLAVRALHIHENRGPSSWTSLQTSYELSPNQLLQMQADWFKGDPAQPFGGFSKRSRIAVSMRLAV
ncbi:MAG: hypothetical protein WCH44_05750, partial [Betaproteobacteria bacterium]